MYASDIERLTTLGLSSADCQEDLTDLIRNSGYLSRQLREETAQVRTYWQYREYEAPIDPDNPVHWDLIQRGKVLPIRQNAFAGKLLTTIGAGDFFTGLVTAGLATPYNSTNAQLAVGDSVTAAAIGQTDLQAAVGTKLNAADVTSASNATPIVVAGTYSPVPQVGDVVVLSAFSGAGAAAINNTFELSAASAGSITLLNSAGTGAITVTGGLVKPINMYRKLVSGAPTATTNQCVWIAIFPANSANFAANEWILCTGGGATNLQSQPPPHVLDRVVASNGTKARGNTGTMTTTLSLS